MNLKCTASCEKYILINSHDGINERIVNKTNLEFMLS